MAVGPAFVAVAILAAVASRYQPIAFGDTSSTVLYFWGMPTGKGVRPVNDMGGFHQDIYIPPQRGTFSLSATIANNGSHPVTIVSASLGAISGLALSGPVRYSMPGMDGSDVIPPPVSRLLRDVVLAPGHEMFIGFPVKMWPCATIGSWQAVPDFTVTTRYLIFRHSVSVPWGMEGDSLIMRLPGGQPGQQGVICAPGTTRANMPKVPQQSLGPQPLAGTIVRINKGKDTGELRLIEMNAPDAAENVGAQLPPCFTQFPTTLTRLPAYRVINFDLNYASTDEGSSGTAPDVRVTIAGPDGTPMIAAIPQGPGYDTIACQSVQSFLLTSGGRDSQEVLGLTLRVPLHITLGHLLVSAGGHTITVPLVPDCSRTSASNCFQGDQLGGPWMAGTPYSVQLRL